MARGSMLGYGAVLLFISLVRIQGNPSRPVAPSGLNLAIRPEVAHIPYGGSLDVSCSVPTPVRDCQFRVLDWKNSFPVLEFGRGQQSPASQGVDVDGYDRFKARYWDRGLHTGDCGLTLSEVSWGCFVVGCRVRAEKGGWEGKTMTFCAGDTVTFNMSLDPTHIVAPPGSDLSVSCASRAPLDKCLVTVPGWDDFIALSPIYPNLAGRYQYHGGGLRAGQCGVTLPKVTPLDNGVVWCWGERAGVRGQARAALITVIEPPCEPELTLTSGASYVEGATLEAECTVRAGRPVARITWLLGDRVLRQDPVDDVPGEEWAWPWDKQTITQRLTVKVTKQDNGKVIICRAEHIGLMRPKEARKNISVKGKGSFRPGIGAPNPVVPGRPTTGENTGAATKRPPTVRPPPIGDLPGTSREPIDVTSRPTRQTTQLPLKNELKNELNLVIEPSQAHFAYRGNLTVLCQSAVPLADCQFKLNHWKLDFPVIQLAQGAQAPQSQGMDDDARVRYKAQYFGTGLQNGQCGILLTEAFWGRYVVSCRARAATGGWEQATMTYRAGNPATFNMTLSPTSAVVLPGSDVSVLCESKQQDLDVCQVTVQTMDDYVDFSLGAQSESTSHHKYFGTGLQSGQCGVTVLKVTEEDNGPVWCWGEKGGSRGTGRAAIITVAEPPIEPELTLISGSSYREGDELTAMCSVKGSRPVASIMWLLGDRVLRQDSVDDVPVLEWRWPWDKQTITQRLTFKLTRQDDGKDLICRAGHLALRQGRDVKTRINLNGETKQPGQLPSSPAQPAMEVAPTGTPATGLNLVIEPSQAHFAYRGNLTVLCQSAVPLADCQFKLNHWKLDFPVIQLAQGAQAPQSQGVDDDARVRYKAQYFGTGLQNGQCGILLTEAFWGRYVVSCRARAATGGWEQATMTYRAGNPATFNMTLNPTSAVVLPGSDVSVLCESKQQDLDVCQVTVQTMDDYVDFSLGAQSEATSHHKYFGTGLQSGQCGVTVLKVTEEDNGPVWCWGEKGGSRGTGRAAIITVAEPPAAPELSLPGGTSYAEGDTLTAMCSVKGSRPVASMTWLLGDRVIRQDAVDDVPVLEWRWPWDKQTITQRLAYKLTKQDNGKEVICRAGHLTLREARETKMRITVNGISNKQDGVIARPGQPAVEQPVAGIPATALNLVIEPSQAHFAYRGNLTVLCQSAVPLADCQFKLNHWKLDFPVIQLAQGAQAPQSQGVDDDARVRYKAQYFGTGLQNGQCGILLTEAFWGRYVVSCRARAATGGWEQATMTYRAGNPATFNMTLNPTSAVVLPGSDVSVLCESKQQDLDVCQVTVQTMDDYVDFSLGAQSEATSHHKYFGTGLQSGQCGVTVLKVTEEDNGPVWCWGEKGGSRGTGRAAIITVAEPPAAPELSLPGGTSYAEGDTLTAMCSVKGSRPVASMTWLLGDRVIRQDAVDDVPVLEWRWPWDKQTITQRLAYKLTKQDNGKEVICRAGHLTLREARETKMRITVNGISNKQDGVIARPGQPAVEQPVAGIPATALNLVIEPSQAHFAYRGNLTVLCQSAVPLADCQFKLNHWKLDFPVIQLAQGAQAPQSQGVDDDARVRYKAQYFGTGLQNGQCGILLTEAFWGRYVVSCRARAATGGWEQATMTYRAGNPATFNMTLSPTSAVVLPGSDVSVLCESKQQDLDVCQVTVQTMDDYVDFSLGAQSEATSHHKYFGTGLQSGQCGVTVLKVTEEDNGPVWCWGEKGGSRGTGRAAIITVAEPPAAPELSLPGGTSYAEGDTLSAMCSVKGSRPVASMTWLLGDRVIRQDAVDDVPVLEWRWPWDKQTITQRLAYKLTKQDNGKEVICRAGHLTLREARETKIRISVNGGSIKQDGVITRPGKPAVEQPVTGTPATALNLVIEPSQAHFAYRGNLTVLCQSTVPLADCQFKLNHWKLDFPVIQLAQGAQAPQSQGMDDDARVRYKAQYFGTGLQNGQCGILLTEAFWGRYVVSCRARAATGGWEQATMTYRAGNPATFNMTLNPTSAVVLPGSDVSVLCESKQQDLDVCQVTVQTMDDYVDFSLGAQSEATSHHKYFGTGLQSGQCGVTVLKVTEEDNGPVWCWGEKGGSRGTGRAAIITVAEPPTAPELSLPGGTSYAEGDTLTAMCSVKGSRPVASMTWLLGDRVLRQDAVDDVPVLEWRWPWDKQTITQRLAYKLTKQDNGKEVICRAGHLTLQQPRDAKIRISVNGGQSVVKPVLDVQITVRPTFDTQIPMTGTPPRLELPGGASYNDGDLLTATCTVEGASPVNGITWLLGGAVVRQDAVDEAPWDKRTITQTLTLRISRQDDGKELICRAAHIAVTAGQQTKAMISVAAKNQPRGDVRTVNHFHFWNVYPSQVVSAAMKGFKIAFNFFN